MKFYLKATVLTALLALCACGSGTGQADGDGDGKRGPVGASGETTAQITVQCGVDLQLTPSSGIRTDWMDRECGWNVAVDGNVVTLTRRGSCGDECGFTEEIVLDSADDDCPTLLGARLLRREAMTSRGPAEFETVAETGRLEIQDWDLENGVFSGHLDSEVSFTFYASRAE